jgi:hypothetical protein
MELQQRLKRHCGRLLRRADSFIEPLLPRPAAAADAPERRIVVHYHTFKTAGTSIDHILGAHFGLRWIEWEASPAPEALAAQLAARRKIQAVSSHWAAIRLPKLAGARFLPIVFLRHPIDRIPSVYRFYRKYPRHREAAADIARCSDLATFVEWQLGNNRQFRNLYAERLACWRETPDYLEQPELARALITLAELPFVGLTERFDESIRRLNAYLQPHFPGFRARPVRMNATRKDDAPIEQRLRDFRAAVGDRLYDRLLEANQDDLVLYDTVLADYSAASA